MDAGQLRDRLGRHWATGYVAVDPGPERRVRRTEEFLAALPKEGGPGQGRPPEEDGRRQGR